MNSFNEFVSRDNRGTTQRRRLGQPRDIIGTSTRTTAAGTELTADGTTRDNRRGHGTDGGRDNRGTTLRDNRGTTRHETCVRVMTSGLADP